MELRSEAVARRAREHALRMVHQAKASHIGAALSMIDLLAVLYDGVLNVDPGQPEMASRDRMIVSKGHAAVGLYAVIAECGFIAVAELDTYGTDGSRLLGHVSHHVPGIEMSTGSLGHGLPVGCGLALALPGSRVVVLTGDGEMQEGSNWEALLFAGHHGLANLTLIVDANGIQGTGDVSEVMDLAPLPAKLESFGWRVIEIDGHDHAQIRWAMESSPNVLSHGYQDLCGSDPVSAFHRPEPVRRKPTALIARTVKGKGVDFMENSLDWHYKCPNDEQLAEALRQVAS